jgi:hypothetical protein
MRHIIVFDFETDGKISSECNPVQVAAKVINPYKLEEIPGEQFSSFMRPNINDDEWEAYTNKTSVAECAIWHSKNYKCTPEEIFQRWKEAPSTEHVWQQFSNFVNKFNPKKTDYFAPIAAGANIRNFDLPIVQRLNEKYGIKTMFWKRDAEDIMEMAYHFLSYRADCPNNFRMETLREYFKVPVPKNAANAHDAMRDVDDELYILLKFLRMKKHVAEKWDIPK